jgi:hypothetical protein
LVDESVIESGVTAVRADSDRIGLPAQVDRRFDRAVAQINDEEFVGRGVNDDQRPFAVGRGRH